MTAGHFSDAALLHHRRSADLDPATLYRILRLRVDVFVVEQACPYPELDGRDLEADTWQYWVAGADDRVLATLRLLADPPADDGSPIYRIGRVCTERSCRGQGLTARLMAAALEAVGDHLCRIEAQAYLVEMYGKFGFVVEGAEYLEDGIPHVSMRRGATAVSA